MEQLLTLAGWTVDEHNRIRDAGGALLGLVLCANEDELRVVLGTERVRELLDLVVPGLSGPVAQS